MEVRLQWLSSNSVTIFLSERRNSPPAGSIVLAGDRHSAERSAAASPTTACPCIPVLGAIQFRGQPADRRVRVAASEERATEGVPNPRATVGPDGSFAVSTYDGNDGAPKANTSSPSSGTSRSSRATTWSAGPTCCPPSMLRHGRRMSRSTSRRRKPFEANSVALVVHDRTTLAVRIKGITSGSSLTFIRE